MRTFLLVLFFSAFAFAQEAEIVIPVEGTLILTSSTAMLPIANEQTGGISFLKVTKDHVLARKINTEGSVEKSMEIKLPNKMGSFLDAIHIGPTLRLFFTKGNDLAYMDIHFETDSVTQEIIDDVFQKDEKLIGYYGAKNKFYCVTISKESKLAISVFNENEAIEKFYFEEGQHYIEEKDLAGKLFGRKTIISIIKESEEASSTLNFNPKKLYVSENKITISIDYSDRKGEQHTTDIFSLDLSSRTIDFQSFDFPTIEKNKSYKNKRHSRSYVKDDYLFQFIHNRESLKLSITDRGSGEVLVVYEGNEESMNDFTAPIKKEIPKFGAKDSEPFKKNIQFLRALQRNPSAITIFEDDSSYTIKLGSIELLTNNNHRLDYMSPNSSIASYSVSPIALFVGIGVFIGVTIANATAANPPNYGTTNSIYLNEKDILDYYTTITLNKETLEVEKGDPIVPIYEMARRHERDLRNEGKRLAVPSLFKIRGEYYFSYFSIKERSFLISKL